VDFGVFETGFAVLAFAVVERVFEAVGSAVVFEVVVLAFAVVERVFEAVGSAVAFEVVARVSVAVGVSVLVGTVVAEDLEALIDCCLADY
jgi:hypothetical protein